MIENVPDQFAQSKPVEPANLFRSSFARGVIRFMARLANPALQHIAGSRWFSPFGLLLHRGRRSGRRFITPVGVGWRDGTFMIPLTFGDRSHWYQNVIAAGECSVRWKGREQRVGHPVVVGAAAAKPAFSPALWMLLSLVGIRSYMKVEPIV